MSHEEAEGVEVSRRKTGQDHSDSLHGLLLCGASWRGGGERGLTKKERVEDKGNRRSKRMRGEEGREGRGGGEGS